MTRQADPSMRCPCGRDDKLEACCGRFLSGAQQPSRAEELMRSRYTAYALGNIDYVMDTHDPETRQAADRENAATWAREADWRGLQLLQLEAGEVGDDTGIVEFKARFAIRGANQIHHERSIFRRIDGRWFYVRGEPGKQAARAALKVGRNDPCPCGSGRKYKKCCGAAAP